MYVDKGFFWALYWVGVVRELTGAPCSQLQQVAASAPISSPAQGAADMVLPFYVGLMRAAGTALKG